MNSFGSVHLVGKTIYKLLCHMNWVNPTPLSVDVMDANDGICDDGVNQDSACS